MSTMKVTLIGMNSFFEEMNDSLFKNLVLPEDCDRDALLGNILLQGADFEVTYPSPYQFQYFIGLWSKKMQPTFTRWFAALALEYNPLENYDRIENWNDNMEGEGTSSSTGSVNTTTTDSSELKKSAYDETTYSPYEQTQGTGTSQTGSTDSTETTTNSGSEHEGRIHGNIGVTTSQQMLESELELGYWNVYEKITELFLKEFCIPVYM